MMLYRDCGHSIKYTLLLLLLLLLGVRVQQ